MEAELGRLALGLLNGLVWGWVLALLALGLSLIYGTLRIINIAHGAYYMLGAMLGWWLVPSLGFGPSLVVAPLMVGTLGVASERLVLRPIRKPAMELIATFGLLMAFEQGAILLFGPTARSVANPVPGVLFLFGRGYPVYQVIVAGGACLLLVALWLLLERTRMGSSIRAVSEDRDLALGLGLPVERIYTLTFGLGAALAAVGGVLVAPIVGADPTMGTQILIMAFAVVIVGGSPWGAVWIAVLISEVENLLPVLSQLATGQFMQPTLARVISLSLLIAVLLLRPGGLLRRRDS